MRSTIDGSVVESRYDSILAGLTPEIRTAAVAWYRDAERFAESLTIVRPEWTVEIAASVMSALSPRERWESNKAKALTFARGGIVRGLGMNLRNARNATREGFAALRGCKTNAFARAIAGDPNAVVIDTWMLKPLDKRTVTPAQYGIIASTVVRLAARVELTPRETQAAIWIIARGAAE